ncbi:MAG: POTRA domain-containing protein, partial [Candidatus Kryptoniota bacterium]
MRFAFLIFFLFVIIRYSFACWIDPVHGITVRRIIIEGNKVTKSWVIQKLLGFSRGDVVTPADLAAATQKLYKS